MSLDVAGVEDAPAKVNLALHVRHRRADGFHELETLFAFTRFGDRLLARPADVWRLEVAGPMAEASGPLEDNLVLRAARAFAAASGSRDCYALRLEKRIPVAAGLGGGSADAGAALRLLNRLAGSPLADAALETIGAGLGADVPACVRSRTAWGQGVGEELDNGPQLSGKGILLVNPRVAVPTGPVFRGWDGVDRGALGRDWRGGRNDLEASAVALQPVIAEVLGWLRALPGVEMARMSGSGATCLALFDGAAPDVHAPAGWWMARTELL
ncbi:4-(cytidine 5'-diphospho)-2-C-methyl-D-erythritol kinase [Sandaracinobacteroides hominis]|uniref:4-(cytidine 5'-diphospho)-2-C-methyl-D-erythritol kinase n=1 Tax=Sandaracinobacteroides hominis TaxID=2780086 RepID=UPI0018F6C972|nr:4-(cytidine 5'-diphospho)-2-C-methyl-D-erythritol kinase [Sandaracinobacteroides hominis]